MGDSELMMLSDALEHRSITNTVSTDNRTVTVPEDEVDSKEELQEIFRRTLCRSC